MSQNTPLYESKPVDCAEWEVRAFLDGRKSQLRRLVVPQPSLAANGSSPWTTLRYFGNGKAIECGPDYPDNDDDVRLCPYGQVGHLLWVREPLRCLERPHGLAIGYTADDGQDPELRDRVTGENWQWGPTRVPSLHMPRWASRVTLHITDIDVQRLQDMTDFDAYHEGIEPTERVTKRYDSGEPAIIKHDRRADFADLWNAGKKQLIWDANPWVWVITVYAMTENIDRVIAAGLPSEAHQ